MAGFKLSPILAVCLMLVANLDTSVAGSSSQEKVLADSLLQNYSPLFRPVVDQKENTNISVDVQLYRFVEMDDKKQALTAIIHYEYQWMDEFLKWSPDQFGGLTEILLSPSLVWTPAVRIVNRLSKFEAPERDLYPLNVNYMGEVRQQITERVQFGCLLDMAMYPQDKQSCHMHYKIGDDYYNRKSVNISSIRASVADPPLFMKSTEFSVDGFLALESDYDGLLEVIIEISRIRNLMWTTMVIPTSFVTVMMASANLLPPDSEAKLDVIMNTYLALAIYTTIIGEKTPSYTDEDGTPYVLRVSFTVMVIGFINLVIHVLIIRNIAMNKHSPNRQVFEIFRRLAQVLWIALPPKYEGKICAKSQITSKEVMVAPYTPGTVSKEGGQLQQIIDWLKEKDEEDEVREKWYIMGSVVDRMVAIISFIIVFAINMDSW